MKKGLWLSFTVIMAFAVSASALDVGSLESADEFLPENVLSVRPDDSVYMVLKFDNVANFLDWLMADENIRLVTIGESDARAFLRMFKPMLVNIPIRSMAVTVGINKEAVRAKVPFMQAAFTFSPEVAGMVKGVENGQTSELGVLSVFLGANAALVAPFMPLLLTKERDNIFRINNALYMKAVDNVVILGTSITEIRTAVNALQDKSVRLFTKKTRRFKEKDFAFLHVDMNTCKAWGEATTTKRPGKTFDLNTQTYVDSGDGADGFVSMLSDISAILSKPLDIEFSFEKLKDKFVMSTYMNVVDALKDEYADVVRKADIKPVKGGNLSLSHAGTKSPLAALSGYINLPALNFLNDRAELKSLWKFAVKQLQDSFSLSEDDITGFLRGSFSLAVNDSVKFENFKIPAVYISQTGQQGAAKKVFEKLAKSPHFHEVMEGVLQLDTSISPVSFQVRDAGEEMLEIDLAELSSISGRPVIKPALESLMNSSAIATFWVDFAEIQSWLHDDENGFMIMLDPIATNAGYGRVLQIFRDIMNAELSVPSMSFIAETLDVFRWEFAVAEINPNNGVFSRWVRVYEGTDF